MKNIKPEDKVTLQVSYGDLAAVYYALSRQNGHYGYQLWKDIKALVDSDENADANRICNQDPSSSYFSVEDEFLGILFPQESEEQKLIRELEETISKAQQQIAELKKVQND